METRSNQLERLAQICQGKKVYIQTHNFPDADAIASAYGLQQLLAHKGIAAKLCYEGRIDKISAARMLDLFHITMYAYDALRQEMEDSDYIICVDSQKNAGNITDFIGDEVACIDHHPVFTKTAYLYSDIRMTGACATIIASYYVQAGLLPDATTATALLYGIKMDTLQFTRGVTAEDIEMFAFLHPLCDKNALSRLERNNLEMSDLKAYGAAIDHIGLYGRIGISFIPIACPDALIASISDFILSLEEVDVAIVSAKRQDGIKLSVRSEIEQVHAGYLVREALQGIGDGGGHPTMAGGLIPQEKLSLLGKFPEYEIRNRFLEALDKERYEEK